MTRFYIGMILEKTNFLKKAHQKNLQNKMLERWY
jgi:hypothetical protein